MNPRENKQYSYSRQSVAWRFCIAVALCLMASLCSTAAIAQENRQDLAPRALQSDQNSSGGLDQPASWQPASYSSVRRELFFWLSEGNASELQRLKVEAVWPTSDQEGDASQPLLDRVAITIPILAPDLAAVLDIVQEPRSSSEIPPELERSTWHEDPLLDHTVQLLVGRWLCESEFYDEALERLQTLDVDSVIDPASLLFYRGIASQRLLEKENTIADFEKLLENRLALPHRYERIAELVLADIKPLKQDTLEEIVKLMDDVRRRQSLHRSGARVLEQEQTVVDKLTKLIEDLEQQQKEKQSGQQSQSGSAAPSQAMESSRIAGGRGEGNVDRKSQSADRAWGDLDPQDRAAALAELAKDLPAHYREVIEDYFRKLAEDDKVDRR